MSLDNRSGEQLFHGNYDAQDFEKVAFVGNQILKELKGLSLSQCFDGDDERLQCAVIYRFIGLEAKEGKNSYANNKLLAELFVKMTNAERPYLLFRGDELDPAYEQLKIKGFIRTEQLDGNRFVIVPTDYLVDYASGGGIRLHLDQPLNRHVITSEPIEPPPETTRKKLYQRLYACVTKHHL